MKRIGQRLNSYHQSVPNQSSVILYTLPPPNTNMSGFVNYGDLITLTTMCGEKEGHLNADGVIDNSLRILVMEKKISIPAKFRDCSKKTTNILFTKTTHKNPNTKPIKHFILLSLNFISIISNPTTTLYSFVQILTHYVHISLMTTLFSTKLY